LTSRYKKYIIIKLKKLQFLIYKKSLTRTKFKFTKTTNNKNAKSKYVKNKKLKYL